MAPRSLTGFCIELGRLWKKTSVRYIPPPFHIQSKLDGKPEYPHRVKQFLIIMDISIAMSLVPKVLLLQAFPIIQSNPGQSAQDWLTTATAVPMITDEFSLLKDVGWYASFLVPTWS